MKKSTFFLIIICILFLATLCYPSFSNFYNTNFVMTAMNNFKEHVAEIKEEDYSEIWNSAIRYNEILAGNGVFQEDNEQKRMYEQCINIDGTGIMGYVEIPKIDVALPIYHGTSDEVLVSAIGHLDWTSLPTGGENTHCVLSGHRGLPSAKLLTDLDKLREGDTFTLYILDEILTYEVDQIRTVEPTDSKDLQVTPGKDYCTLLTCTPYGINTHRLLVRGHRIANIVVGANVTSEAVLIDQIIVAIFLAVPLLFILFLMVLFKKPEKSKDKNKILKEYVSEQEQNK